MKGAEGGESVGEGDEVLDLDICPGTPPVPSDATDPRP